MRCSTQPCSSSLPSSGPKPNRCYPQTPPPQPHHPPKGVGAAIMAAGRGLAPARQHGRCFAGTGISTRHPSTTPVGLALGPDSPRADEPGPGTLGLSALGTPTPVIATHACILTPAPSTSSHPQASPGAGRSPTTHNPCHHPTRGKMKGTRCRSAASAVCLSPATLSAHDHLTSELLCNTPGFRCFGYRRD